ncbi:Diadenosine tetraphosphate (Ap4A) hydrolase [Lentibacillus persicus]|uniref:Diadenosine tetraphosphate (Ap4A) hydrolase n=1 Tax=Lentibacillus persicus TaxID=640948 RepID=A0A1I1VZM7_9BACI|nr:HIT family protein [Lentibacillus persicus]SFD88506.1 Diadenosine tetraphosphate (Ap4A) hydrolase [Lentibacillus persicus]
MIKIADFEASTLYLNRDQTHEGRCILAFKDHKREVYELTAIERDLFMKELSLSAKLISDIYDPDKINYGIFGDLVSHLHVHIVPKYVGEKNWGEAFTNNPKHKKKLHEFEYKEIISQINKKLIIEEEYHV